MEKKKEKALQTFMSEGKVKSWPAKLSKQIFLLEELVRDFELGVSYEEKEVNTIIANRYEDYCLVRRMFVDLGFMRRENNTYQLLPEDCRIQV